MPQVTREVTRMHSLTWAPEHVLLFRKEVHPVLMSFPLGRWLREKLPVGPRTLQKTHWLVLPFLGTHREAKIKLHAFEIMNES